MPRVKKRPTKVALEPDIPDDIKRCKALIIAQKAVIGQQIEDTRFLRNRMYAIGRSHKEEKDKLNETIHELNDQLDHYQTLTMECLDQQQEYKKYLRWIHANFTTIKAGYTERVNMINDTKKLLYEELLSNWSTRTHKCNKDVANIILSFIGEYLDDDTIISHDNMISSFYLTCPRIHQLME